MTISTATLYTMMLTTEMRIKERVWFVEGWRYAMGRHKHGAQCAITSGLIWMLLWLASKQDYPNMVSLLPPLQHMYLIVTIFSDFCLLFVYTCLLNKYFPAEGFFDQAALQDAFVGIL